MAPAVQVPGKLSYREGDYGLELWGESSILRRLASPPDIVPKQRVLVGATTQGTYATCIDYVDSVPNWSSNRMGYVLLFPARVLYGSCYFTDAEGIAFRKSRIRILGLEEWLGLQAIAVPPRYSPQSDPTSFALQVPRVEPLWTNFDGFSIEFTESLSSKTKLVPPETVIGVRASIEISSEQPRTVEWHSNLHWQLKCLLSFLADRAMPFDQVTYLADPSNGESTWIQFFASYPESANAMARRQGDLLLRLKEISSRWRDVLYAWVNGSAQRHGMTYTLSSDFFHQSTPHSAGSVSLFSIFRWCDQGRA
jgi:hypothetical protein